MKIPLGAADMQSVCDGAVQASDLTLGRLALAEAAFSKAGQGHCVLSSC